MKKDVKTEIDINEVEENKSAKQVSRRGIFNIGLAGLATSFVAACSSSKFKSSSKKIKKASDEIKSENDPKSDAPKGDVVDLLNGTDGADCFANNTTELDVKPGKQEVAKGDLIPKIVFYGHQSSKTATSMLAFKFTSAKVIDYVIITKEDGKLLAHQGITGADKNGSAYRAIVVDNLFLFGETKINLLIKHDGKLHKHTATISYFDTFQNKPVIALRPDLVKDASFNTGLMSVTRFAEVKDSFNFDKDIKYPKTTSTTTFRGLNTVTKDSQWTANLDANGLLGIITDVMGEVIDATAKNWILEHQTFMTYRENNGKFYRTILMIG